MNNLAIVPYIALHALQIQNVKRNVVKKVDTIDKNQNQNQYEYHDNNDDIIEEDEIINRDNSTTSITNLPLIQNTNQNQILNSNIIPSGKKNDTNMVLTEEILFNTNNEIILENNQVIL